MELWEYVKVGDTVKYKDNGYLKNQEKTGEVININYRSRKALVKGFKHGFSHWESIDELERTSSDKVETPPLVVKPRENYKKWLEETALEEDPIHKAITEVSKQVQQQREIHAIQKAIIHTLGLFVTDEQAEQILLQIVSTLQQPYNVEFEQKDDVYVATVKC